MRLQKQVAEAAGGTVRFRQVAGGHFIQESRQV